jgi:hypothetical protein
MLAVFAAPVTDASKLTWTAALLSWVLAVPLWYVTKYVLVIAHEGGHALLLKLCFQALRSVTFDSHGGGLTRPEQPVPWPFTVVALLAGYLGPSLFGLIGVWLLVRGQTQTALWASVAFLVAMLFAVRGVRGWLLVPGLIVIILLVAVRVDPPVQTLYTHMWVWFLLIGAVQRMLLFLSTKQYEEDENDAAILEGLTLIPSEIWTIVFLVGTIAALTYGGATLLQSSG